MASNKKDIKLYFTIVRAFISIVCVIYFVDSSTAFVKAAANSSTTQQSLHIAVASNFNSTAKLLTQTFNKLHPTKIILSSASTGKLTTQIRYGAPFDVFLAADRTHPELLIKEKFAYKNSRTLYAQGQLALISKRPIANSSQTTLAALATLAALENDSIVAIANPKTAPYGLVAMKWLLLSGFNEQSFRFIKGENISQTWQYFHRGGADAAIVAMSQVIQSQVSKDHYWLLPQSINRDLQQVAVILTNTHRRETAQLFLDFLRTEKAQNIIQQAGYRATIL